MAHDPPRPFPPTGLLHRYDYWFRLSELWFRVGFSGALGTQERSGYYYTRQGFVVTTPLRPLVGDDGLYMPRNSALEGSWGMEAEMKGVNCAGELSWSLYVVPDAADAYVVEDYDSVFFTAAATTHLIEAPLITDATSYLYDFVWRPLRH